VGGGSSDRSFVRRWKCVFAVPVCPRHAAARRLRRWSNSSRAANKRKGHYGHDGGGSPVASYRSQAARTAACSSRATLGDLAGLPLLMSVPCSHREQISTRGSDAALAAPICPQCGQMIRVSISKTTAAAGAGARGRSGFPRSRFSPSPARVRRERIQASRRTSTPVVPRS
jgi:hypothetical protein